MHDPVLQQWAIFGWRNRHLFVSMLGYAAIPPILDFCFAVGPPWPHQSGVVAFTSVVGYIVAILAYVTYINVPATRAKLKRLQFKLTRLATLAVGCGVVYLGLRALFLYEAPTVPNFVAGGFIVRESVAKLLDTRPGMTLRTALEAANYVAEDVWEPWTVACVNLGLLLTWLALFGLLGAMLSVFVVYLQDQYKLTTSAKPSSAKGGA